MNEDERESATYWDGLESALRKRALRRQARGGMNEERKREIVRFYVNLLLGVAAVLVFAYGAWLWGRAFGWVSGAA